VKKNVVEKASLCHLSFVEEMESPILGGDGNKEFLLLFEN
jgi:predicted rRNA methylase YqxC with S4 and FtsJ domains